MQNGFKLDFIGIGTDKCATTWIYRCLQEHPQICGPQKKEIHFFNKYYDKGIGWYEKFFSDCTADKIIGEYTPGYLFNQAAAERIKKYFPDIKLIVCFRNPVDRLSSKHRFDYSRGKTSSSINKYFREMDLEDILYYKNLKRYLDIFPENNIHVLILEDANKDRKSFIQGIYKFLGVTENFIPPSLDGAANVTVKNKTKFIWLNRFLWGTRKFVRRGKLGQLTIKFLRGIGFDKIVKKIFKLNTKRESLEKAEKILPNEEIVKMVKEYYREDIKKLESFLGRDLSDWYE